MAAKYTTFMLLLVYTLTSALILPISHNGNKYQNIKMFNGKGFGGGEATRDPDPTYIDPNNPKAKQTAIFKAETYQEYLARKLQGEQVQNVNLVNNSKDISSSSSNERLVTKGQTYEEYLLDRHRLSSVNEKDKNNQISKLDNKVDNKESNSNYRAYLAKRNKLNNENVQDISTLKYKSESLYSCNAEPYINYRALREKKDK